MRLKTGAFYLLAVVLTGTSAYLGAQQPANTETPRFLLSETEEFARQQLILRGTELQKQINVLIAPWQADIDKYQKMVLTAHGNPANVVFDTSNLLFRYIPPTPSPAVQTKEQPSDSKQGEKK